MISDKQRRNQLIQKIQKMPADKLKELHDFANKLDLDSPQWKKFYLMLVVGAIWKKRYLKI